MDGGVLLCQLVEGVGTVRDRGRVSIFAVCTPHVPAWYTSGARVAIAEILRV